MKNIKVVTFVLFIILLFAVFTACNRGTNLPSEGTANVEITSEQVSSTQSESETAQDFSSVYHVTEADDLEIMTTPAGNSNGNADPDDKSKETSATYAVVESKPDKEDNTQEETKIELPFIPAN